MVVDRTFMQFISGNALYAAAIYIGLGVSAIVIFMSFLGLVGALSENRLILMIVSNNRFITVPVKSLETPLF
jgi:hypothetical protein